MNRNAIFFSVLLLGLAVLMAFWYEPKRGQAPSSDPQLELSAPEETTSKSGILSGQTSPAENSKLPHVHVSPAKPLGLRKVEFTSFVLEPLANNISLTLGGTAPPHEEHALHPPPSIPALPIKDALKESEKGPPIHVVTEGPSNAKEIALTFDDGPHPTLTSKVLDILREKNVKATFFVLGDRVKLYPSILHQIAAEGHEIGNHTYSHRWLLAMSNQLIDREIAQTQELIQNAVGYKPHLFRPPYGSFRPDTKAVFREHKLDVVLWSVDPKDWNTRDSAKLVHAVTNRVRNGSIVLCHDIHKVTLQALPTILDTLKSEGYEFKTVSHLCGLSSIKTAEAEKAPSSP